VVVVFLAHADLGCIIQPPANRLGACEAQQLENGDAMTFKAIPTKYKDIEFRSRLEAKWACMFDQLGWSWEYEPIDLNGYIPDFHIDFGRERFFVEIKPAMTTEDLWPALDKALGALGTGRDETILVLGGSIGQYGTYLNNESYVWHMSGLMCQLQGWSVDDVYLATCPTCFTAVPLTHDGLWGFPCCLVPDGDNKHHRHQLAIPEGKIERYWATATNTVKYRQKQS
jgi:hypothetical protein